MLVLILLLVIGLVLTFFFSGIRIIRPTHRGLVETMGSYTRFAGPGFNWIIPMFEELVVVDITEQMMESGEKQMITSDNLNVTIDAVIFYKVKATEEAVKASQYAVADYEEQIVALTKTALRNIIGTLSLKSANSERGKINLSLQELLNKETAGWGIEVVRAELKEIDPPKDVQETMNKVVKAENEKVAAIDFATAAETKADGEKRSAIKQAEGNKQAEILYAEGRAQASEIIAKGRAQAIEIENEAADKHFKGNAIVLRKIEAIERSFKDNTKVIVPQGQGVINLLEGLMKGDGHVDNLTPKT